VSLQIGIPGFGTANAIPWVAQVLRDFFGFAISDRSLAGCVVD